MFAPRKLLSLVTFLASVLSGVEAAENSKPNVLVILTDDQRWDALGVVQRELGSDALFPWFKTPIIDRIADEGARFRNVFVTTSLCSPSRASLLSGVYARRHKVTSNFAEYPAELPNYPAELKKRGYETAYIGKWHMGEDNDEKRPGFDSWMSHRSQGNYVDNEFNLNGTRKKLPGYYTQVVTDLAVEWLQQRHDKPWMLILGHKAPHGGPIVPEPRFEHALDEFLVRKPANFDSYKTRDGKPAWLEMSFPTWHGAGGPLYGQNDYAKFVRAYLSTLLSVDESVGRLYETLKSMGQLDQTVVVFTSDNGFALGQLGRVDKRTAYEDSLRIPLLVRYPPRIKPGTHISHMTLTHDLAPSLLDLCGAPPLPNITGLSWVPLLENRTVPWRDAFLYEYNYEKQFPYTPNVRAVRTDRWKFIRYPSGNGQPDRYTPELYDLLEDPLEMRNLASHPDHAERRKTLEKRLEELSQTAGPDQPPVDEGILNVLPNF